MTQFLWQVRVVLGKELIDALRDRRSLMSALLFPLFGPVLIGLMFTTLARTERQDQPLKIPVVGADRAPSLVSYLEQGGAEILEPPDDPETAVREGEHHVVIVIPEDYSETFGEARRATVQVLLDSSRRAARTSIQRTLNLLTRYDAQIAALRLMAHGVSPEVMRPLDVESVDLASRKKRAARRVLDVLPMFFILAAFIAGVNVAIDTTAGERERQSLEPLLTNPVSRYALVLGKWMTTLTFCAIGVILTVTFTLLALRQTSFEGLGVQIHLGSDEIAGLLAAALPMAPLAASVQMFFATFARSFKEAQTYVTLLPLAAMVPTVMLQLAPIKTAAWMMLVPALGQQQLLMDTLAGENHGALFVVAAVAAVIYALLGVIATASLLSRERIVLGR